MPRSDAQLAKAAARSFAINERLNQMLIEDLNPAAWTAKPPGGVRTIAAIFTHVHNIRIKWVRLTAPHLKLPAQLSRAQCTRAQVRAGLAKSSAICEEMLAEAMGEGDCRIASFRRDAWARPWPVGVEMLCYMLAHEAHHRGQACMVAHQLGFRLTGRATAELWNWEKLLWGSGRARAKGSSTPGGEPL